jgi:hypothetical protein
MRWRDGLSFPSWGRFFDIFDFGRSKFWSRATTRLLLSGPLAMVLVAVAVAIVRRGGAAR